MKEIQVHILKDGYFNATDLVAQWNKKFKTSCDVKDFIATHIPEECMQNMMYEINGDVYLPYIIVSQLQFWAADFDFTQRDKMGIDIIIHTMTIPEESNNNDESESKVKSKYKTYLMLDENSGAVKIGRSYNPSFREHTLSAQIPRIKLIAICNRDVEKILHKEYATKRMRGEWFNLTKKDVNNIVSKYGFKKYSKF